MAIYKPQEGGYMVITRDLQGRETSRLPFSQDQVESYKNVQEWYLDDLGGMESQFVFDSDPQQPARPASR